MPCVCRPEQVPGTGRSWLGGNANATLRVLFPPYAHIPRSGARPPHSDLEFYGQVAHGRRWTCGYTNIQMLAAWLLQRHEYRDKVFRGCGYVPSLSALQAELERAWADGFDAVSAAHFGYRVSGGSAWIGTSEAWALLRSYGVCANVVRFSVEHTPAAAGPSKAKASAARQPLRHRQTTLDGHLLSGTESMVPGSARHDALFRWVWQYFRGDAPRSGTEAVHIEDRPPLYLQHEGHSRTIAGIERNASATGEGLSYTLLVLDPAVQPRQLEAALGTEGKRWQSVRGALPYWLWLSCPVSRW